MRNPFKKPVSTALDKATLDANYVDFPKPPVAGPSTTPLFGNANGVCSDCGGLFLREVLKEQRQVRVYIRKDGAIASVYSASPPLFCKSCHPKADLILRIVDFEGDETDVRHFRTSDLYFQEVDKDSGEDIYTASTEEYSHIFCANCGNESEWERCENCDPRKAKEIPGKKSNTRRLSTK